MGRRILLLATMVVVIFAGTLPALADKRIALIVGNANYENVKRLENPRNDAMLMATTLRELGFTLVGDGPQLDLDKAGIDRAIQKFSSALQGADVTMFYYAGHGVQVRGSNYLVPVGTNPTREADVDFQMVDVNVVLRQMEGSGTRLNLVVLDACRNNPFGSRGLRASDGGLAQMRAPEGTLISFATQPGSVALDGEGNSPYTKALAATIRRRGLDIFQTFNEVGLAVKRATGGEQQPWVSSSPIDGNFYFSAPPPKQADKPAAAPDPAGLAWTAIRDTTSVAVIETFIQQYGNSLYGPFARARRDELKGSQIASTTPKSLTVTPREPRLSKADVVKLFEPFELAINKTRASYVDPVDGRDLYGEAIRAMQRAFPAPQQVSSAGPADIPAPNSGGNKGDISNVYETALSIANMQASDAEDRHIVSVATNGMLASLDPHSGYLDAKAYEGMQTQNRGEFGGLGLEVTMENGLIKVVTPFDDTPAAKAGIRSGDLVMSIDDKPLQGLNQAQAVQRMRGPVNSSVKLSIVRQGQEAPVEMTITREIIHARTVRWHVEQNDIGYIRITTFNQQTADGFKEAIDDIARQVANDNLKGYIIDLRNNSGGLLDAIIKISDDVLDHGEIFSTRGRKDTKHYVAKPGDLTAGKRIVVLINGGTASGSEIVAGAMQDNKRAMLVGTRSFGIGSVQTILPLGGDNGAVRLTTARNFTPSGNSIQAKGIVPDIQVLQNEPVEVKQKAVPMGEATLAGHLPGKGAEEIASQSYVPKDPKDDKALAKAAELLHTAQADAPSPQTDAPPPKFKRWKFH